MFLFYSGNTYSHMQGCIGTWEGGFLVLLYD